MQAYAENRLSGFLQAGEGELRPHQIKNHRSVFKFPTQPAQGGGQNTPMVEL